ncbi:hypothetical protein [Fodinicurvata sediminis]|uniref:hypothetical protein n=1 Tax=Fodinicurvata sediminis TaxID=1121832 RepID=UPI0003B32290|nr:hypothetical protein [Fodinicurvata sediminis]
MLTALLELLRDSGPAVFLRGGRWSYGLVNGAHILGLALLGGAILPLDLRLAGLWRSEPAERLARVLLPVAMTGLGLAVATGLLLFSVRPFEYLANPFFLAKLALVALAVANALWLRLSPDWRTLREDGRVSRRLAAAGLVSLLLWIAALFCGRLVAFV